MTAAPTGIPRPKVLFLCTGNTARSQMAEGLLRALAGERFDVYSAGLEPGELHPFAVEAMSERGIDISGQRPKSLDRYLGRVSFAFVITVCDRAARECPVFAGTGERLHWSIDDPAAATGDDLQRLATFREARDAIEARMREWLATMPDTVAAGTRGRGTSRLSGEGGAGG